MRQPGPFFAPSHLPGESTQEYRERLQHHEDERRLNRERELAEIASPENSAPTRIRYWERAHQLVMPSVPGHRMLRSIAANTGLTLSEVEEEQRSRAARRVGMPPRKVGLIGEG